MSALYAIGDFVEIVQIPVIAAQIPKLWYMLRLHPNLELKIERRLLEHGKSVYVPKEKRAIKTLWNRKVLRDVPLFAGVMFVPDFEADLQRLKNIADGIGGFIKYDGTAVRVSLRIMYSIRRFEERMQRSPSKRKFKIDQSVRVIGGPFDMFEGKIERLDSRYRLRVLLDILKREVPVEFDEDQIEAV